MSVFLGLSAIPKENLSNLLRRLSARALQDAAADGLFG
jgi:hypothetical protein